MDEHWFDALNKALVGATPRRGLLSGVVAFLAALLTRAQDGRAGKRNKKKRKKKRTKRRKQSPFQPHSQPQTESCSRGACAREFASQTDREYCEFICQQCDGDDPRQFCIVQVNPFDLAKAAFCCAEGRECCGNECCGPDPSAPDRRCCNGKCVNTDRDPLNCGACGERCPAGWECEPGRCVCRQNCSSCPPGRTPCGVQCCSTDQWCYNQECCPETYLPPDRVIPPPCLSIFPDRCRPDSSFVCCEDFGCFVGANDPSDWVCCGDGDVPLNQRICVRSTQACPAGLNRYPALATHTYGE